ncbi:hypothetical protein CGMCC3_g1536 [Colletotrichum fructicola]|nr:uncharacterized protein CGMCC3_g1536 [Colletotrichum fructicola]KAE9582239.1 hypothetical protein CGMCC3_g1536 [Colletotrichum fructicola]
MIIPTNGTLAPAPTPTMILPAAKTTSVTSFSTLGVNEILTIAFGIVASLTAVMAVMIGCMQLKRARSPRPAGDRRVNIGDVNDIGLRPVRGNARAASAPPGPGRTSEGSTLPGSNRMRNGATM